MSFGAPLWLLALTFVPVGIVSALVARRRARRYAARFPATVTLRAAAATDPSWQRHLPAALLLCAVGLLALALARPRVDQRVAVGREAIMLVSDHSGSMAASDVTPTRLAAAQDAANAFIKRLPGSVALGAINFSTTPDSAQGPVTDHAAARAIVDTQSARGGTDTGDALRLAIELLGGGEPGHRPAAIVLLSDGAANAGPNPVTVARQAGRDGIGIDTLALGTVGGVLPNGGPRGRPLPVPPDPRLMGEIARASGARAYDAASAGRLSSIYRRLAEQLATVSRTRDLTVAFVIAAGVLVLVGMLGSVRWGYSLP